MGLLPTNRGALLDWIQAHANRWEPEAVALGLTVEQVAALADQREAAAAAVVSANEAKTAAKAATAAAEREVKQTEVLARQLVQAIRTHADGSADPAVVYEKAGLPPRKKPTPSPVPAAPTDLSFRLESDGSVTIACNQRRTAGLVFTVQRRSTFADGQQGQWEQVLTQGGRTFVDATVPPGAVQVEYQLRAHRGTQVSLWSDPVVVRFTALDNEATPTMRLAA